MRTVHVRFRQIVSHNGVLHALDVKGNLWKQAHDAPQGWKRIPPPSIEIEEIAAPTQIPQNLQAIRTVHFDTPLKGPSGSRHSGHHGHGPKWR